jgi:hypothetical protein
VKKLLLAPACLTVLAYAVMATNSTPQVTLAETPSDAAAIEDHVYSMAESLGIDPSTLSAGPDVITAEVGNSATTGTAVAANWGTWDGGTTIAISLGSLSCNMGTSNLNWIQNGTNHPVISQSMFRVTANGRFEQIGIGYVKHSFCALQQAGSAGQCSGGCGQVPGCQSWLGPGCVDPYTASRNGDRSMLGPRWQVNAFTGEYSWPYAQQGQQGTNAGFKRIQLKVAEINPSLNPGQILLGEVAYTSRDDALAGNQFNNVSSRRLNVTGSAPAYGFTGNGASFRTQCAIQQWPQFTGGSAQVNAVDVPGEGRFFFGHNVRNNGDGTWTYIYAVHNMNSDRSGYKLTIPVPAGVNVTNINFRDIDYHSGEPYTNVDWTGVRTANTVEWTADASYAVNQNANALRWGTSYTFEFTANSGPQDVSAELQLFKPGTPSSITGPMRAPMAANLVGDMNCDGVISVSDIGPFVLAVTDPAAYEAAFPDCDLDNADANGDGIVTVSDIGPFVSLVTGG